MIFDILFVVFLALIVELAYSAGRRRGAVEVTSILLDTDLDV